MSDNLTDFDAFLSSMTFANGDVGCECDECDCGVSDAVPPTIRSAVDEHVRKRKLEQPSVFEGSKRLQIRQNRDLVKREDGFSIWRLDLPVDGGDPIVEYRNSHRILFVKQLNKASDVFSIGQGIIGSAAEENTRGRVIWEEGSSYFLQYSKGIACGWVHKLADDTESKKDSTCDDESSNRSKIDAKDVVIYSLKVSPQTLQDMPDGPPEDASCWVKKSHELFRRCLAKTQQNNNTGAGEDASSPNDERTAIEGIPLSEEDGFDMNLIVELAQ